MTEKNNFSSMKKKPKTEIEYYRGKGALKPYKDSSDEKSIKRLDKVFSEYIRLFYADRN